MAAQWDKLFVIACDLLDQVNAEHALIDRWSLGGGTAMMLQIGHRESDDIDIFLGDPQLLSYLDPAKRDFEFDIAPASYSTDGAGFLKLAFPGIGEIDFIVGQPLTDRPWTTAMVAGRTAQLETISEIITKKIYYRGSRIAPRDIFDIAATATTHQQTVVSALVHFRQHVEKAVNQITAGDPAFVADMISQLRIRPAFRSIAADAVEIASGVLREALTAPTPASGT